MRWWGEGRPEFFDPRGWSHFDGGWEPPALPERPVYAMIAANASNSESPAPTATSASARWKHEAVIPDEIYFAASEALG